MDRRLKWLLAVHLALSAGQLAFAIPIQNIYYLPLMWSMFAIPLSQVMLLGFWAAMGTNITTVRLLGTLLGCTYLAIWLFIGSCLAPHEEALDITSAVQTFAAQFATFAGVATMIGGSFSIMRKWFAELRYLPASEPTPQPYRVRFSILHLLLLTSIVSLVLGLTRGARTAESQEGVWFAIATSVLTALTLLLNTMAAAWAALAIAPYRLKLVLVFLIAALLGIALSLAMNRGFGAFVLPWWLYCSGVFITIPPTAIVVASLLVVRTCGYRLVKKAAIKTA